MIDPEEATVVAGDVFLVRRIEGDVEIVRDVEGDVFLLDAEEEEDEPSMA